MDYDDTWGGPSLTAELATLRAALAKAEHDRDTAIAERLGGILVPPTARLDFHYPPDYEDGDKGPEEKRRVVLSWTETRSEVVGG